MKLISSLPSEVFKIPPLIKDRLQNVVALCAQDIQARPWQAARLFGSSRALRDLNHKYVTRSDTAAKTTDTQQQEQTTEETVPSALPGSVENQLEPELPTGLVESQPCIPENKSQSCINEPSIQKEEPKEEMLSPTSSAGGDLSPNKPIRLRLRIPTSGSPSVLSLNEPLVSPVSTSLPASPEVFAVQSTTKTESKPESSESADATGPTGPVISANAGAASTVHPRRSTRVRIKTSRPADSGDGQVDRLTETDQTAIDPSRARTVRTSATPQPRVDSLPQQRQTEQISAGRRTTFRIRVSNVHWQSPSQSTTQSTSLNTTSTAQAFQEAIANLDPPPTPGDPIEYLDTLSLALRSLSDQSQE